jgi:hypothetical protein
MTEHPWHEYSGESADELFAMADTHRVDSLVLAFENALGRKEVREGVASLSRVERDVMAVEALEREVNNGGYAQFFTNSSNEYAGEVVDALRRIGCPATAAITERAIGALPAGTALTPESLERVLSTPDEAREKQLDACDQAYYATGEDIATRLFRHLLAHRADIRLA